MMKRPAARAGDEVIVVGGGLIGLSVAFFLHQRGAKVIVIERCIVGSGASRGNAGQIVLMESTPLPAPGMVRHGLRMLFKPTSAFYVKPTQFLRMAPFLTRFALQTTSSRFQKSVARLDILNERTPRTFKVLREHGIGTGIRETPIVYGFSDRKEAQSAHRSTSDLANLRNIVAPGRLLDGPELIEYEPALGDVVTAGFLQTGERWGDPSLFVDELEAHLRSGGVEFIEQAEVTGITENANSVTVEGSSERWTGSAVLIAAGAWSKQLLAGLGAKVILDPGKGYSLAVDVATEPKGVMMFADAHVGATPMGDHTVRLAGTMEFDGRYEGIDSRRVRKIIDESKPYLRGADWTTVRDEWTAPRPMTPDGLPYIGRVPGHDRTYISTGHNMLGFTLSPATGDLIARLITGEADPAAEKAFALDRFR